MGLAEPIPMRELAVTHFASRLRHATLLLQGDDDPTTPVAVARRLAAERPDIVEYAEFPAAGHIRAWNADPTRYEALIGAWLSH